MQGEWIGEREGSRRSCSCGVERVPTVSYVHCQWVQGSRMTPLDAILHRFKLSINTYSLPLLRAELVEMIRLDRARGGWCSEAGCDFPIAECPKCVAVFERSEAKTRMLAQYRFHEDDNVYSGIGHYTICCHPCGVWWLSVAQTSVPPCPTCGGKGESC